MLLFIIELQRHIYPRAFIEIRRTGICARKATMKICLSGHGTERIRECNKRTIGAAR